MNRYTNLNQTQHLFGKLILQSRASLCLYEDLLNEHEINWIVETGTACGALSIYFAAWARLNDARFLTIDNGVASWAWKLDDDSKSILSMLGANVIAGDCFANNHVITIAQFMEGKGLFFCDGGNKAKELAVYAPLCPPDSLVIVHDYEFEVSEADVTKVPCIDFYEPWHTESIELGTKAAILKRSIS